MTDEQFSMPIPGLKPAVQSHRLADRCEEMIEAAVAVYSEDGWLWELCLGPIPTEHGMRVGAMFAMWLPVPIPGDNSRFYVGKPFPDATMFLVEANVKAVVFDFVETIRASKAEWLRGNN